MKMKFNLMILCLLSCFSGFTQENADKELRTKIIGGVAKYRSELLRKNFNDIEKYVQETLIHSDNDYETAFSAVKNLSFNDLMLQTQGRKIFSEIEKRLDGKSSVFDNYSDLEMQVVVDNYHLFGLVFQQILEYDFPYKINKWTQFIDEMVFAGIVKGDKVADIGAGDGTTGILIGVIYDSLDIYLTEINDSAIKLMESKIEETKSIKPLNKLKVIQGGEDITGLEELELDKIILRNSFHHFSEKKKMLTSIKKSLADNGQLIVIEAVKDRSREGVGFGCPEALYRRKLKKIIRKNGFNLIAQKKLGRWALLKYTPIQKK